MLIATAKACFIALVFSYYIAVESLLQDLLLLNVRESA